MSDDNKDAKKEVKRTNDLTPYTIAKKFAPYREGEVAGFKSSAKRTKVLIEKGYLKKYKK